MTVQISTVGIVATAPKLISTPQGVPLCTFRLAVSERRYNKEQRSWADTGTSWFSVAAFRSLGENANASFQVGDRVMVSGKLRTRDWENESRTGTSVDIEAETLGHELRWGTSEFKKTPHHLQPAETATENGWAVGDSDTIDSAIAHKRSA